MKAQLYFITTGKMSIHLQGMGFGKVVQSPSQNTKHFGKMAHHLDLESTDPNHFTSWGVIELIDLSPANGFITVSIDCEKWGWYGTAQIQLKINGQIVLNDNFQSGVRGPVGNPLSIKKYPIANF